MEHFSIDGSHWETIDFISDLHLEISSPKTASAWFDYMASEKHQADAIFILGDWFEIWVGDDDDDPFLSLCAAAMRRKAQGSAKAKACEIFIMHGNRDFLLGEAFMQRCDAQLIPDPSCLHYRGTSYLLTHGDALCIEDTPYVEFRKTVRSSQWQNEFLAKPLEQRKLQAREMRQQSQSAQNRKAYAVDINEELALEWLQHAGGCQIMIHGHTHQAATHPLGDGARYVLSDWDAKALPARTQVLRLSATGLERIAL